MIRRSLVLLACWMPLLVACSSEEEDRIAGHWTAGRIELVLARKEQAYEGRLVIGGKEHAVRAEPRDAGFAGTFRSGSSEFPFQFRLEGEVLKLESGGTRHELKRKVAAPEPNPLAEIGNPLLEVDPSSAPANTPPVQNPPGSSGPSGG